MWQCAVLANPCKFRAGKGDVKSFSVTFKDEDLNFQTKNSNSHSIQWEYKKHPFHSLWKFMCCLECNKKYETNNGTKKCHVFPNIVKVFWCLCCFERERFILHTYLHLNELFRKCWDRTKQKRQKKKIWQDLLIWKRIQTEKTFYQIKEVFKDEKIFIFIFMCVRNWKIK